MGKTVSFNRPDGKSVNGYLAEPAAAAKAPGLVVIQEWWGLNDQIKGVADKLAQAGYRALVPDLYRGKTAVDAKEANHLMTGLNFADAAGQDIRGAVQYLKKTGSPKVGVTGFCMGGALTVLSAVNVPEMDAGVIWYGYPPLEYVDASKIKAPLFGHWATEDQERAMMAPMANISHTMGAVTDAEAPGATVDAAPERRDRSGKRRRSRSGMDWAPSRYRRYASRPSR